VASQIDRTMWWANRLLGPVAAAAIGAICGFAIQWPVALIAMRLNGAGYTGVEPRWDPGFASFAALTEGLVFGAPLAVVAYLLFFLPDKPRLVVRAFPILFFGTALGAAPGVWLGPGAVFTVVPCFLASCILAKFRIHKAAHLTDHHLRGIP
jgi:hypothetical protein